MVEEKYREVEYSDIGPSVKFSRIADDIKNNFPEKDYSSKTLSSIVREAFPNSESRKQHKDRNKFVFGIEATEGGSALATIAVPLQQQVETLQTDLKDRDQQVVILRRQVCDLESQLERSQQRVAELESTLKAQISLPVLENQIEAVLDTRYQVYHGPNTLKNFHNFSIESVISELQNHAPDVFQLLQLVGKISDQECDGRILHNLRPLTAMIALLKNRSVRLLGVQLLLTFTLIARATNKQVNMLLVCKHHVVYNVHDTCVYIILYLV